jgi:hypothetical protein
MSETEQQYLNCLHLLQLLLYTFGMTLRHVFVCVCVFKCNLLNFLMWSRVFVFVMKEATDEAKVKIFLFV